MDRVVVNPEDVRGLGNIVSPKSTGDFSVSDSVISSASDSTYGTLYSLGYLTGSYLVYGGSRWVTPSDTTFSVSVTLKKHSDDSVIGSASVSCLVNETTTLTATTNSSGVATFSIPVTDYVCSYKLLFKYAGTNSIAGCFVGALIYTGSDSFDLDLIADKSIIQTTENSILVASVTGTDCNGETVGVAGQTVYFYEEYVLGVRLTGSASIIQSGETSVLTGQLIDTEDGSLVRKSGETVYFYKDVTSFTDALTSDNGTFILSDTDGDLSFDSNGMKFIQNGSTNNKTFCYIPMVLDVANMAYEIEFDYVSSYTTDNTPFRCCICKASDMSFASWMPLVNTTAGWLINGTWTKTNYHNFTNGDVIKIRLEDGAYKVWRNGSQVATNALEVGEPVFFGFEHWKTNYIVIKNLKFSEVDE